MLRISTPVSSLRVLVGALALVMACSAPGAAAGSSPRKPAWEWTVEERLAERFNPEAMKSRAAAEAAEQKARSARFRGSNDGAFAQMGGADSGYAALTDSVNGSKTPELFLPSELFDDFLSLGFPPGGRDQSETRRIVEERAAALGFGRDLWPRLQKTVAPYLQLQRNRTTRTTSPPAGRESALDMDAEALGWCRTRAAALAAAKTEFGEKAFLQLLYVAATATGSRTYAVKDFAEHARYLRFLEGGCR